MRRGDVWWAVLPPPAGRRPVVLVSRNEAYTVRDLVTVAPVTTRARGIPSEVALSRADGMPRACVVNLDTLTTVPKRMLSARVAELSPARIAAIDRALRFALGLL